MFSVMSSFSSEKQKHVSFNDYKRKFLISDELEVLAPRGIPSYILLRKLLMKYGNILLKLVAFLDLKYFLTLFTLLPSRPSKDID